MVKNLERGRYMSPEGSAVWEYLAAISCASSIFCNGCVFGWVSPSLAILMGPDSPMAFTDSDASTLMAMFGTGFGLSPMLTLFVADKIGRRNGLRLVSIPMIVHWVMNAVAKDAMIFSISKFLSGLATGLGLCLAPMYLAEIASVKFRGALGMVMGTLTNAGILFMFLIVPYTSFSTSACLCLCIATVSMISLWFIPESPYFLAMAGRIDEAEVVLEKLRGKTDIAEELDLVKRTVSREETKEGEQKQDITKKGNAFRQLITVSGNRKAFCISFLLVFVLQFGSYAISMVYSQIVFEAMKTTVSSSICASIVAALQLIFNILTVFVVDRFGRRPLLGLSGFISGACSLVVGIYFYLMEYTEIDVTPYSILPVGAMFVNIIAISFGLMPLQMVVQSEILATEIKALASSLIGISGGIMTVISTGVYLKLAITWDFGHSMPFLGFSFITWTSTTMIVKMLPETKGKTFLEIQRDLNA